MTGMVADFERLQATWERLGQEDPLWAVYSRPDKRGGRWNLDEFLATGETEVARLESLLRRHAGEGLALRRVLDFGCGVGRLTLAWRRRAEQVTGVDISEPMIQRARRIAEGMTGIDYVVNARPDLAVLPSDSLDLCFSFVCLQHIPWPVARGYIAEFGRICRPGGWVLFQLPTRQTAGGGAANWRRRLVESLPLGLGALYRRWRHGSSVVFDVYFTPADEVLAVAREAGLGIVHQEPDASAGENTEGYVYLFRKAAAGHAGRD